jgi:hypothetical protein
MMADVPIHHVKTIYSTVGDLFAWLAIAGLANEVYTVYRMN